MASLNDPVCREFRENETFYYTPERIAFNKGLFISSFVIATCLLFLAMIFKNQYQRTRTRSRVIFVVVYVAFVTQLIGGPLRPAFGFEKFACSGILMAIVFVLPLFASPTIANLFVFTTMSEFSKKLQSLANEGGAMVDKETKQLRLLKFLQSELGVTCFILLLLLPWVIGFVIIVFTNPVYAKGCYGCSRGVIGQTVLVVIEFVAYVCLAVLLFKRSENFEDTLGFRREVKTLLLLGVFTLAAYILTVVFPFNETYDWDLGVFLTFFALCILTELTIVQLYLAHRVEKKRFVVVLANAIAPSSRNFLNTANSSNQNTPHQSDRQLDVFPEPPPSPLASQKSRTSVVESIATVGSKKFKAVYQNPTLLKELEDYLTKEYSLELLLFYRDTREWRKNFSDQTPELRFLRAKKIYKLYIGNGSLLQVNLPYKVTQDILSALMKDDGPTSLSVNVFEDASQEVVDLLEKGPISRLRMGESLT